MKQTAVEWLAEQYEKAFTLKVNNVMISIIEQAKEMEKEQIKDAHNQGYADGYRDNGNSPIDYYNETFKSE